MVCFGYIFGESNTSRVACAASQQLKSRYSGLPWLQTASPTTQEPVWWSAMVANSESNKSRACIVVCYGCKQRVQQLKSRIVVCYGCRQRVQQVKSHIVVCYGCRQRVQQVKSRIVVCYGCKQRAQQLKSRYGGLLWLQTASPTSQENSGLLVVAVGESIDDGVWCIQRQFLESVVWMRWREFLRPTNRVLRHIHSITPLSPLPFFYGWLCLMSSDTPLIDAGGGGGGGAYVLISSVGLFFYDQAIC